MSLEQEIIGFLEWKICWLQLCRNYNIDYKNIRKWLLALEEDYNFKEKDKIICINEAMQIIKQESKKECQRQVSSIREQGYLTKD